MSTSAPNPLGSPVGDGLTWVNFFNGRLLTGDDLTGEQDSGSAARSQLGVAGGAGVVSGLTVAVGPDSTAEQPTVLVTAGLAVNGQGKPLWLNTDIEIGLLTGPGAGADSSATTPPPPTPGDFDACAQTPPPVTTYLTGSGVYVLVVGPAERGEGSAPVNGQLTSTPARTVGYLVDTVQFRLAAALTPEDASLSNPATARNAVAYRFLGTAAPSRMAFEANPLAGTGTRGYGLIDEMRADGRIVPSEVPLAAISWSSDSGFEFIDGWAVRRPIIRPSPETPWSPVVADRPLAEGEAMLLQFQDQLVDPDLPAGTIATAAFRYLPPAGFVPRMAAPPSLPTDSPPTGSPSTGPASPQTTPGAGFFGGLPTRGPFVINAARVDDVVRESFRFPPIDVSGREVIWLYEIRENQEEAGTEPVLLFTSGHVGYRGEAYFDLAYFDYSNYALRREWRLNDRR